MFILTCSILVFNPNTCNTVTLPEGALIRVDADLGIGYCPYLGIHFDIATYEYAVLN